MARRAPARLQAGDVHGASIVAGPDTYAWQHPAWHGRPWAESVIYEAHAGLAGGFAGLAERLPGLAALGITDYTLPGQHEKTPIGGLLQFERWRDRHSGVERIRLAYVYPTSAQLRDAQPLTEAQPPGRVALRVPGCAAQGCTVAEFQHLLHPAAR
ncbi:hypothetical protein G6F40_014472 [Rhizopus arrhizus]|nr:hypothetical protein G6F40_014472 [Rhizopus arrhizus]